MKENESRLIVTTEARFKLYLTGSVFDETDQFYGNILSLPVQYRWDHHSQDRGVMFDTGSAIIELIDNGKHYGAVRGCGISLAVPDVHALWRYLGSAYASVGSLRDRPWGDTDFTVDDPSGFPVTFFSPTRSLTSPPIES
jgi:hypothetical protein